MIPVKNIYYMLAYAFRLINFQGYKKMETESFDNISELCSEILIKGVSSQLKRGLNKEYIETKETLSSLRGKLEITDSIKEKTMLKKQMVCSYDEFSLNSYQNQIIKTTMRLLLHSSISKERKKKIRQLLLYFNDVEVLDYHHINWNIPYNRNNQTYKMLISICYMVINGLLHTNNDGTLEVMSFLDDQSEARLYEKFVLEYYRQEFPKLYVSNSQIPWALDNDSTSLLPIMKSDITISHHDKVLIIDTKYYAHSTQQYFDTPKIHSNNLYQIFTYVKNKDLQLSHQPHTVSGMLLYARTNETLQPDVSYLMSGNRIDVKTLDLNQDFSFIKEQLNLIIEDFFNISEVKTT